MTDADKALMPITDDALVSKSMVGQVMVIASASKCPPSAPIRGKEQAAAKSGTKRGNRGQNLQQEYNRYGAKRKIKRADDAQRAVTGRHDLWRGERHDPDHESPQHRPQCRAQPYVGEHRLAQGHPAHENDSECSREQADNGSKYEIVRNQNGFVGCDHAKIGGLHRVRHQIADQRRDSDRSKARRCITADDQFETVEGACERGAESAGDSRGRAAADQDAKIAAAQAKCDADARGKAAGELRVAGLEAD